MIIEFQPGCKCSLCNITFEEGEKLKYYADESGFVRISHKTCYENKYEV